ncbi:MAG: 2-oxoacid:ferredoxin oxidoreductase subunit beta [Chloroflexota bacterium]
MRNEDLNVHDYLRHKKKFPGVWCAGCGIGIVLSAIIRAVDRIGVPKDQVALVAGIGCTGRMAVYADFNTLHTTHGRALAFATGLKMARPDMHVLVVMGDGDALAIGGNHFIHTARRNMDLTAIVVNNSVYGMTGGQVSPTTPEGALATTAPYGNIDRSFSCCDLAIGAGAAYVARSTVYHATELDQLIERGMRKKGFAVIEALSYCHTTFGRLNQIGSAVEMMRALKDNSVTQSAAANLPPEEREHKIVRGVMMDREIPEYIAEYERITARARGA